MSAGEQPSVSALRTVGVGIAKLVVAYFLVAFLFGAAIPPLLLVLWMMQSPPSSPDILLWVSVLAGIAFWYTILWHLVVRPAWNWLIPNRRHVPPAVPQVYKRFGDSFD